MFSLLLEVVEDLATFFLKSVSYLLTPALPAPRAHQQIAPSRSYPILADRTNHDRAVSLPREMSLMQTVAPPVPHKTITQTAIHKSTVMYTASSLTSVLSEPNSSGDARYATLPYGSMVMVLDADGVWAKIASGPHVGWVHVDDLEDCAADVYPTLRAGVEYSATDDATIRLRAVIADEFGAGEAGLPLQPEEYVLYRVYRRGVRISWPAVRPRTPGVWHTILADVPGIDFQAFPRSGVLMEYLLSDENGERGALAYVEAVFPDRSIQISEVVVRGAYRECVLTESQWSGMSPLFFAVS